MKSFLLPGRKPLTRMDDPGFMRRNVPQDEFSRGNIERDLGEFVEERSWAADKKGGHAMSI